jgi:lipopolysaccharide/colanic/teichoic acid biosynthesis glycosyltransferase
VSKRLLDLLVTLLLLPALPLMAAIALWVRLDSPGPALFRQQRVGRGGRPVSHPQVPHHAGRRRPADHRGVTRITRAGRWLRAAKLDELPQLIDVLRGDMSLVGPRPEVPRYMALPGGRASLDPLGAAGHHRPRGDRVSRRRAPAGRKP